jgi:GT2 family glycosyltransferase
MSALESMERNPEVSIILVNYNDRPNLEDCLLSLRQNVQGIDFEIIVVDNNSSDGSQDFVEKEYPRAKLIRNQENLGFAKANNLGIKESKGEFILFLNTDTVIYPQTLENLLKEMREDSRIGAVGPALLRGKNAYQISFGKKVSFLRELIQKCLLNSFLKLWLKISLKKRVVGWLSGACFLTRKDVLEKVGTYDENFFLYFEDIDLCYRMKKKGYKLLFLPQARIFHRGGATTLKLKILSRYEYRKSQIYFYQKHNSRISLSLLRCYLWINFAFIFLFRYLKKDTVTVSRSQFFDLLKKSKK